MSTHSLIGYELEDGTIEFVYCHCDGYPEHQLPILTKHYNTREKAIELVSKGRMFALLDDINNIDFYTQRGEELQIYKSDSVRHFFFYNIDLWQEYSYYIDLNGEWHYKKV